MVQMVVIRPLISNISSPIVDNSKKVHYNYHYYYYYYYCCCCCCCCYYYYYLHLSFSHQLTLLVLQWSFSDSNSPQLPRTLLTILALRNNVVVWMIPLVRQLSSPAIPLTPLVTVTNALITIGMIVTCIFHSFFNSLARSRYLSFFSHSFSFILWSAGIANWQFCKFSFLLLIIIMFGLLAEIRWSVCTSKSQRSLCVSFSWKGAGLCI